MDPLIANLESTTFLGQRLRRQQIADIQKVVRTFPKLSRTELGHTLCTHLRWQTPKGRNRIQQALRLLEALEEHGILSLPPKRGVERPLQQRLVPGPRSDPQSAIAEPLRSLLPLQLTYITDAEEVALWNEFVERYHPLGYRRPCGPHLRYFLRDRQGRTLGCLLFDFAAPRLACRDKWLGWQDQKHHKYLHLVVRNARYLLFPWVTVPNLASHALALAARQLPQDWQREHGTQPVLLETYVDPQHYRGTCYQAAGWQNLGSTKGTPASGTQAARTPKQVWVYPLHPDFRKILRQGPPKAVRQRRPAPPQAGRQRRQSAQADAKFVQLWQGVLDTLTRIATDHDREWVRRPRKLNTLLVVLFVYRIVFQPDKRSYATVLEELWDHCRELNLPLPSQPVTPAAICRARFKVSENFFLRVHRELLAARPLEAPHSLWCGHRTFAVDGSKLNLPRPLAAAGYPVPGPKTDYPQGLFSCLYQLRTGLPLDFGLHAHADEQRAAHQHLKALRPGDVVVYDCGYYCFALVHAHLERGLHAVFRLQRNANSRLLALFESGRSETVVTVAPPAQSVGDWRPLRVRLVSYLDGSTVGVLATTLLDPGRYPTEDLQALYQGPWSIEEYYKTTKKTLLVEQFRGRSERLVRQELYAHCTLTALDQLYTNRNEAVCQP